MKWMVKICLGLFLCGEAKSQTPDEVAVLLLDKNAPIVDWREYMQKRVAAGEISAQPSAPQKSSLDLILADMALKARKEVERYTKEQLSAMWLDRESDEELLQSAAHAEPDYWIPKMVALLNHEQRWMHDRAARVLSTFHREKTRAEALKQLIPWVGDPGWATSSGLHRLRVIQSLSRFKAPDSVPGLRKVLNREDGYYLSGAADALAYQGDQAAIPELKAALKRKNDRQHKAAIIFAIDELKGFSVEEIASSLISYFQYDVRREGKDRFVENGTVEELKGSLYDRNLPENPAVAEELLKLSQTQLGQVAEMARVCSIKIGGETAWENFAERLVDNQLSVAEVEAALSNRKHAKARGRFEKIISAGGSCAGFSAVILDDREFLNSDRDLKAKIAYLAAARFLNLDLSLEVIERFIISKDHQLAAAALGYLTNRTDSESKNLLVKHDKQSIARKSNSPGRFMFGRYDPKISEYFYEVLNSVEDREVFCLLSNGGWGGDGHFYVFVSGDKANLIRDFEGGRIGRAKASTETVKRFREYTGKHRFNELPPLMLPVDDGIEYEFVHISKEGVSRVYMDNPPGPSSPLDYFKSEPGIELYSGMVSLFYDTFGSADLKIGYGQSQDSLVLMKGDEEPALTVWKSPGGSLHVMLNKGERLSGYHTNFEWFRLSSDGTLGEKVSEPAFFGAQRVKGLVPKNLQLPFRSRRPFHNRSGDALIQSGEWNGKYGLWRCRLGETPQAIVEKWCLKEVVSSDGRWCIAAKVIGRSWAPPNEVILIDLKTDQYQAVDLPPSKNYHPIAYLPLHKRFLIHHLVDGADEPDHYLLDPETKALEAVEGDFRPLNDEVLRPLQVVDEATPHLAWATRADEGKGVLATIVGHYDRLKFEFTPKYRFDGANVGSQQVWIDSENQEAVAVVKGDVVRFSLK